MKSHVKRILCIMMLLFALSLFWLTKATSAKPLVQLIVKPFIENNAIQLGSAVKQVTVTARVDLEGVTFHWTLNGPGTYEVDPNSRKLYYTAPEHLTMERADVVITVMVTADGGETVNEQITLQLHDAAPLKPTPTPSQEEKPTPAPAPTMAPTPAPDLAKLLEEAEAYFKRTFYTEPEGRNALSLYREVLRNEPGNQEARQKLRDMLANLKQWAEKASSEADSGKAQRYLQRYGVIAQYMLTDLGEQNLKEEFEAVQKRLKELETLVVKPPTPTPLPGQTLPPTVSQGEPAAATPELAGGRIKRPGEVYAVIIGLGNYADGRIPSLRFTENDAQGLYDVLTDPRNGGIPPDHVMLLRGQAATERNIKHAMGQWLHQQAQANDLAILYYAGHGAYVEGEGYWVTYDAEINDFYATALNLADILDLFKRIPAKQIITFLDTCYTAIPRPPTEHAAEARTGIPWEIFPGEGRLTISATDGRQCSLELEPQQHGIFTYYLLEGLKGEADANRDGLIDVMELWDYLKLQVAAASANAGATQTPQLQGTLPGIPLTMNLALLQKQQEEKRFQAKQARLIEIYRTGGISVEQFTKAMTMLKNRIQDQLLEDFLAGKLTLELFKETF